MICLKNKVIGFLLKKLNGFDNLKLKFALECLYTFFTKLVIIAFISVLLGIEKQVLLLILLMFPLRAFGFGIHAKSNTQCWIASLIMYNLIPFIVNLISINYLVLKCGALVFALVIIGFAPAPTKNIPLLNKKKNSQRKIILGFIVCFYLISIIISNYFIKKIIFLSLLYQAVLVCPLTYKLLDRDSKTKNQFFNHWF